MPAPFTIGQAADLVDRSIQRIDLKSSDPEMSLSKYYNVRTTTDLYEKDSSLSGLSESDFVDENAVISSDVPIQNFDQTYTQYTHGTLLPITHMQWRFGIKKRNLERIVGELRKAIIREKEKLAAERLTSGFTTTYSHAGQSSSRTITITGGDGLEPWHTSHTREDGGTGINNVVYDGTTYSIPFDYAGYKAVMRTMGLWVDPRGNPRPGSPDVLVCKKNSSVHYKAQEILAAIKKGMIPESNDNDGNAGGAFRILPLDYLTQDAYYFFMDSSRALSDEEGFQHVESVPTTIDSVNTVYKTKEIQVSAHSIYTQGHNDVTRSWVVSAGDSSTT